MQTATDSQKGQQNLVTSSQKANKVYIQTLGSQQARLVPYVKLT